MSFVGLPKLVKKQPLTMWQQTINLEYLNQWLEINEVDDIIKKSFYNIRNNMLGDRDSWKQREYHASAALDWEHDSGKDGADAMDGARNIELKINWISDKQGTVSKLRGSGVFNDYSQERLDRLYTQNYLVAIPLYVGSKLFAMPSFPAKYKEFYDRLGEELRKKENSKRISLKFSLTHYKECPNLNWEILPTVEDYNRYKHRIPETLKKLIHNAMVDNTNKKIKRSNDININE